MVEGLQKVRPGVKVKPEMVKIEEGGAPGSRRGRRRRGEGRHG